MIGQPESAEAVCVAIPTALQFRVNNSRPACAINSGAPAGKYSFILTHSGHCVRADVTPHTAAPSVQTHVRSLWAHRECMRTHIHTHTHTAACCSHSSLQPTSSLAQTQTHVHREAHTHTRAPAPQTPQTKCTRTRPCTKSVQTDGGQVCALHSCPNKRGSRWNRKLEIEPAWL